MSTKTIEEMQAARRELDRKIKAAQRAEIKVAKAALLSERQALGVWLAESAGADTLELVQRLRTALSAGHIPAQLRQQIAPESSDSNDVEDGNRSDFA